MMTPFLPARFFTGVTNTPWSRALAYTATHTPGLVTVIVAAGLRGWKAIGTKRFSQLQVRSCALDVEVSGQPDLLEANESSLEAASAQGVRRCANDARSALSNWDENISDCQVPVEIWHGTDDPMCAIEVIRAFVDNLPDNQTLFEVPGAGFWAFYTHQDAFIERIRPHSCKS